MIKTPDHLPFDFFHYPPPNGIWPKRGRSQLAITCDFWKFEDSIITIFPSVKYLNCSTYRLEAASMVHTHHGWHQRIVIQPPAHTTTWLTGNDHIWYTTSEWCLWIDTTETINSRIFEWLKNLPKKGNSRFSATIGLTRKVLNYNYTFIAYLVYFHNFSRPWPSILSVCIS